MYSKTFADNVFNLYINGEIHSAKFIPFCIDGCFPYFFIVSTELDAKYSITEESKENFSSRLHKHK